MWGDTGTPGASAGTDARTSDVIGYIDANIDDPELDADRLQARFRMSRPTLYRLFQGRGGVSRYIRERRLAIAHRQLRQQPDSSITRLLYDLGFASERQFQRAFQTHFGMSPAKWRECCRSAARQRTPWTPGIDPVRAMARA